MCVINSGKSVHSTSHISPLHNAHLVFLAISMSHAPKGLVGGGHATDQVERFFPLPNGTTSLAQGPQHKSANCIYKSFKPCVDAHTRNLRMQLHYHSLQCSFLSLLFDFDCFFILRLCLCHSPSLHPFSSHLGFAFRLQ